MDKGFEIPRALLMQLNECSNGGFILFTYNDEGEPMVYPCYDSQKEYDSLCKHVERWVTAADENQVENYKCILEMSESDAYEGGDDGVDSEDDEDSEII